MGRVEAGKIAVRMGDAEQYRGHPRDFDAATIIYSRWPWEVDHTDASGKRVVSLWETEERAHAYARSLGFGPHS